MLDADDQLPGNLDEQVRRVLNRMPDDVSIWQKLSSQFKIDLFCGFFMEKTNEGIEVSAKTLRLLGERSICLDVSIYAPTSEEDGGQRS